MKNYAVNQDVEKGFGFKNIAADIFNVTIPTPELEKLLKKFKKGKKDGKSKQEKKDDNSKTDKNRALLIK